MWKLRLLAVAATFLQATACWATACAVRGVDPCADRGTALFVCTGARELHLCDGGHTVGKYPVALGRGGVGKRREGDGKTPLGEYGLGAPRASQGFATFIPVEYPTAAQARAGFTGSAVGIHGPPRAWRALGAATTWTDWTLGCIALPDDDAIAAVARFVRAHRDVHLRVE